MLYNWIVCVVILTRILTIAENLPNGKSLEELVPSIQASLYHRVIQITAVKSSKLHDQQLDIKERSAALDNAKQTKAKVTTGTAISGPFTESVDNTRRNVQPLTKFNTIDSEEIVIPRYGDGSSGGSSWYGSGSGTENGGNGGSSMYGSGSMGIHSNQGTIKTATVADEGHALCAIADKIPQLTTYPSMSPTQRWSKSPTCPTYTSTTWCAWKGVTCVSGSVTAIDLSTGFGNLVASNGLGKTALSALTALTNVASFNMAGNSLTGNIPTTIAAMTSLTYLDLSGQASNQLYGSIPKQFSALTNLLSLQLYGNRLTQTIPSYIGSALTKLTSLGLYSNSLTGTLPATMSALTQLLFLRVDTNVLQGTIPAFFGNTLTQMTTLNLGSNFFTGTVPVALSSIGTLTLTYTTNCLSSTGDPTSQTHCFTPTG